MQILNVSASPHIRDNSSTQRVMSDVVIALLPALFVSYLVFGWHALVLTVVTILSCVFFEWISNILMKRPQTVTDVSAVVTGILLAFNLPATFPWWMAILGSFIAIVGSKMIFGGLGYNITNPALTARVFLLISFPQEMTNFQILGRFLDDTALAPYDLTRPRPRCRSSSTAPGTSCPLGVFIGFKAGCIGEISALALLIGATYLFARKVIDGWIPFSFIATTLIVVSIGGQNPLYHLLSGGLILGAFFMATDYVTTPYSNKGKLIFGIGCGLLTGLIRLFGSYPKAFPIRSC